MSTILYLIRHAEAEGNIYRRCQGIYDSFITKRGLLQLDYLAKRFEDVNINAVYSSHLYRARNTANAVAKKKDIKVILRKNLHELNMGEWEDCPWEQLNILYAKQFEIWKSRPWEFTMPNGENICDATIRVFNELEQIAKKHENQNIVVVSHGSVIRSVLCKILNLDFDKINEIGWGDNTCVAKIVYKDNIFKAQYWNDASHLPQELSTFAAIGWKDNKGFPSTIQVWFKPVEKENQEGKFYCMHENENIGFVELDFKNSDDDCGVFKFCYINPKYRKHGIFKQCLGDVISKYRKLNKKFISVFIKKQQHKEMIDILRKFDFYIINEDEQMAVLKKEIYVPSVYDQSNYFEVEN